MSNRHKRIVAFCLIAGGLVLVVYNFLRSTPPVVHGQIVDQAVHLDSLFTLKIEPSEKTSGNKEDILALFVLKSDVCPPCVNNTLDYIELLNETKDKNIATSALFVEKEAEKVHRFVRITELPIPYRFATKKDVPKALKNSVQQLLFINVEKEEIFYRITIPGSVTTALNYKQQVMAQVFAQWEETN